MTAPVVRVGDTVRVVVEGKVKDARGGYFILNGLSGDYLNIYPRAGWFKSVEVLAQPPKVGDTIEGAEAYEALPVGAVVTTTGGTGQMMKTRSGLWVDAISELHGGLIPVAPRVLVYLPETGDSE